LLIPANQVNEFQWVILLLGEHFTLMVLAEVTVQIAASSLSNYE